MNRLQDLGQKIERREAEVAIIGLGYVGLPLALALVRSGFRVTGIDKNEDRVAELSAAQSHIEDVSSDEIRAALQSDKFNVTSSFAELSRIDCIQVCVPTPLTKTKDPDVSFIVAAVDEVKRRLRSGQLVVLGSTTYPGTTHELYLPMLEDSGLRVGEDFCLAFAPERIDPANREFALNEVPKVVGGETDLCRRLAVKLFAAVFDSVISVSSTRAAEMVKLLENTFRMINIGLANEIARICDTLGLDVWEIIDAAATKPYGFMKFQPGPGLGGHCIPVDPNYLAWKLRSLNFSARFIELASEINSAMPGWVVERISRRLNVDRLAVNGARILLLGMAYKADVSDTRESPALDILVELERLGAQVDYHDPWVPEIEVEGRAYKSLNLAGDALSKPDLVVITTAHSSVDYAEVCEKAVRVLDTRNATRELGSPPNVERL